ARVRAGNSEGSLARFELEQALIFRDRFALFHKELDHVARFHAFNVGKFYFESHEYPYAYNGLIFSGFTPRSLIACSTTCGLILPCRESRQSVAMTTHSASTSKCRRRAARVSLRPMPSVPRAKNSPGT